MIGRFNKPSRLLTFDLNIGFGSMDWITMMLCLCRLTAKDLDMPGQLYRQVDHLVMEIKTPVLVHGHFPTIIPEYATIPDYALDLVRSSSISELQKRLDKTKISELLLFADFIG